MKGVKVGISDFDKEEDDLMYEGTQPNALSTIYEDRKESALFDMSVHEDRKEGALFEAVDISSSNDSADIAPEEDADQEVQVEGDRRITNQSLKITGKRNLKDKANHGLSEDCDYSSKESPLKSGRLDPVSRKILKYS